MSPEIQTENVDTAPGAVKVAVEALDEVASVRQETDIRMVLCGEQAGDVGSAARTWGDSGWLEKAAGVIAGADVDVDAVVVAVPVPVAFEPLVVSFVAEWIAAAEER